MLYFDVCSVAQRPLTRMVGREQVRSALAVRVPQRGFVTVVILGISGWARGLGGRHAPRMSPRQLKEVIQVTHTNVGSVASLGALVGGEVHR